MPATSFRQRNGHSLPHERHLAPGRARADGRGPLAILPAAPLERAACLSLFGFAAALPFSIAAADILVALTTVLWLVLIVRDHERISVPPMFWPLAAYAGRHARRVGLLCRPALSLVDSKQLCCWPSCLCVYRLLPGRRRAAAMT